MYCKSRKTNYANMNVQNINYATNNDPMHNICITKSNETDEMNMKTLFNKYLHIIKKKQMKKK